MNERQRELFEFRLAELRWYRQSRVQSLEMPDPKIEKLIDNIQAGFVGFSALCGALVFVSALGAATELFLGRPSMWFIKNEPDVTGFCTNHNGGSGTHADINLNFGHYSGLKDGVTVVTTSSTLNRVDVISDSHFYTEVPKKDTIHAQRHFKGRIMLFKGEDFYDPSKRHTDLTKMIHETEIEIRC